MRRRAWFSIVLIALIGCGISVLLSIGFRDADNAAVEAEFRRAVDERVSSFEQQLALNVEGLYAIQGVFIASEDVSHKTFAQVSQSLLSRHPNIQALEWIPKILETERESAESARKNHFPTFQISERNDVGEMAPVSKKEIYFPVYYVEPYVGNEPALGFDLSSNPVRLATLQDAAESGSVRITASVSLVQETGSQKGFLAFMPVYRGEAATAAERTRQLRGFALGVYRVGDIFSSSILGGTSAGIEMSLLDETVGGDEFCVVFPHVSGLQAAQSLERIRERLQNTEFGTEDGWRFRATATFGLTDINSQSTEREEPLIKKADQALYVAKQAGRNCIAIDQSIWTPSSSKVSNL